MPRLKFDKRRKTNISRSELKKLYEKKCWSVSRLAKRYNCTYETISYWLRRYGLRIRTASQSMKLFANKPSVIIPKSELRELFKVKKFSLAEIAKHYNCKIPTILNRLSKYNITDRFSKCKRVNISKKELQKLYTKEKLSTYDISVMYGCCQATIWKRLKAFNIKRRKLNLLSNVPSKRILRELYVKKRLSTWEIERTHGYSRGTVHRKLKEYGLIRSRAEAHIKYKRKSFSGNLIEKAYLIGFKLGDLRSRKKYKNGTTIYIDCGSTKIEQIKLIKKLFSPYSRVWVSKPSKKNKVQVEAFLDLSFSFLLPKTVPSWILRNKKHFLAFVGGFTDSEGCFCIHKKRNQASYSLGNYDYKLLFIIRDILKKYGFIAKGPYECDTSNYFNNDGYGHNQNYWTLNITKKTELYKFIKSVEPYLQHKDRLKALKKAEKNIIERNLKFNNIHG